ncbi:hypothetical protein NDN16_12390 [Aureimonas altamirensis]|uniref:hypothetical protein n=1 Tax=Aureimonas altamirensis TaxID=370622 RepID=UPI002036B4AE|nr:hypothetical protein [Aureimonas altamirensis]MCM2504470.1 hypothetical protein [Aureimonas altamirensis]
MITLEERLISGSGLERGAVSLDTFGEEDLRLLARLHERGKVKLVGTPGTIPYVVVVRDAA